jgi:hypothetical protein
MLILILLGLLALAAIPFTYPSWRMLVILITLALIVAFALGAHLPGEHGATIHLY